MKQSTKARSTFFLNGESKFFNINILFEQKLLNSIKLVFELLAPPLDGVGVRHVKTEMSEKSQPATGWN